MPLRVPKYSHILVRPILNEDGSQKLIPHKKNPAITVPAVTRIKVAPGKPFRFLASEIAEIEAAHGEDALKRAHGPIEDADDPEALPEGPDVTGQEDGDDGKGKGGKAKPKVDDDDL